MVLWRVSDALPTYCRRWQSWYSLMIIPTGLKIEIFLVPGRRDIGSDIADGMRFTAYEQFFSKFFGSRIQFTFDRAIVRELKDLTFLGVNY